MEPLSTQSLEARFELASKIKLGKTIADGNGTIYAIKGQPNKVVKVVYAGSESYANKMIKLLAKLKRDKDPAVVRIYQYGKFHTNGEPCYYYVMDKLNIWARNNWDLGDKICSWISGYPMPSTVARPIKSFVKKARKLEQKYHYGDVHTANIMKTKRGALRFVDLESFTYGE